MGQECTLLFWCLDVKGQDKRILVIENTNDYIVSGVTDYVFYPKNGTQYTFSP